MFSKLIHTCIMWALLCTTSTIKMEDCQYKHQPLFKHFFNISIILYPWFLWIKTTGLHSLHNVVCFCLFLFYIFGSEWPNIQVWLCNKRLGSLGWSGPSLDCEIWLNLSVELIFHFKHFCHSSQKSVIHHKYTTCTRI